MCLQRNDVIIVCDAGGGTTVSIKFLSSVFRRTDPARM
jgi:hypothetical protein